MACALVPFCSFQDLESARDFLCPHARQGGAGKPAGSKESGGVGGGELSPLAADGEGYTVREAPL